MRATSSARCAGATRCSATRSATSAATCRSTAATARARCPSARSSTRRSPGATTARPTCRGTTRSSTSCTCGASRCSTRTCRRSCAAPTPGSPRAPVIDHLKRLGVTAVELMPVHAFVDERRLVERGCATTGATTRSASSRPTRATRARGKRQRVQDDGEDAAFGAGIEVILDVVYNHTAEGNQLGPTLCFRGIDNASYYRLQPDDAAPLRRLHGLRQHAQHAPPARAAADHGLAALLGDGDARRRLPLRPRLRARARAACRRPPRRVLRRRSARIRCWRASS